MKKNYDFSKAVRNPYYKKLKGQKLQINEEISFDLRDLVEIAASKNEKVLKAEIEKLRHRVAKLEKSSGKRK